MAKLTDSAERPESRRRFMKWMAQIAAGTSLAGLGLGLSNN